jgi:hypothetical protein
MAMRTTIDIEERLLLAAKKRALESGSSLSGIVEDALKEVFSTRKSVKRKAIVLITAKGKGIRHGVDLENNQSLLDIMDS